MSILLLYKKKKLGCFEGEIFVFDSPKQLAISERKKYDQSQTP